MIGQTLKILLYCVLSLILVVVMASAIGYVPMERRWGAEGVSSMMTVSAICLGSAVLAVLPLALVVQRWPDQIGQAVLAGTVIRRLVTMGASVGYQMSASPHLTSFLAWATIMYLLLLAVETGFGVYAIRRFYRAAPAKTEGAAS